MRGLKRIVVPVALAGALTLGGVAAAAPAQATEPIPGHSGCYWYSWYDYMYLFHGVAGYCLTGQPGVGPIHFDSQGNYW